MSGRVAALRRARLRWTGIATIASLAAAGPVAAAPPEEADAGPAPAQLPPPPADPDETPFMRGPRGQPGQFSTGRAPDPITRGFSDRRRLQLTVLPVFATFRLPWLGRSTGPVRGGGASLELDTRLLRWLWLRVHVSHTEHPVETFDRVEDDGSTTRLANAGRLSATSGGLSLVYPLDLGRFVPLVDVGVGGLWIRSPEAAINGQFGGQCREGAVCDYGLACGADFVCRPTLVPEVHAGIGVDVMLGLRWALGAHVRYHALLEEVAVFPVYLMAGARLGVRF